MKIEKHHSKPFKRDKDPLSPYVFARRNFFLPLHLLEMGYCLLTKVAKCARYWEVWQFHSERSMTRTGFFALYHCPSYHLTVLPLLFLRIKEHTANRIGESIKSKRHKKANSTRHLLHSVFKNSRPCHLRFISVSTTGCVKYCGKQRKKHNYYIIIANKRQPGSFCSSYHSTFFCCK